MAEINFVPARKNTQHGKATKAVLLVRVSSKDQEDGYSLQAQRFRLEQYCQRKGLDIIRHYELTESSTVGDRNKFMKMLDFIKAQKETVALVVDKVDRLQRSFKETPLLDELMQKDIIELHFNSENAIIHKNSTSQERMMWNFSVIMAQSYIDSMKDNVSRAIEHKIRRGECITIAPIGYFNIKDENGKSTVIVDVNRAPLIKKLFEEYATGLYSYKDIAKLSKKLGLKNKQGNKSYLSFQQVSQIFNQPFYYGEMRVKGQLYKHIYPPIISRNLFDRCKAVREARTGRLTSNARNPSIFKGILRCAASGRLATPDKKVKKYKNGSKGEWSYLVVRDPENLDRKIWIRQKDVQSQIENILKRIHIPIKMFEPIKDHLKNAKQAELSYHKKRLKELQKEYNQLQKRNDRLTDLLLDGVINKEDYEAKRLSLREKQDNVRAEIKYASHSDDGFNNALSCILELASNVYETYKNADIENKRKVLNFVFSNLSLNLSTLCYSLNFPFDMIIKQTQLDKWQETIDLIRNNSDLRKDVITTFYKIKSYLEDYK